MIERTINPKVLVLLLSAMGLIVLPHINHIPIVLFGFFGFLWFWRLSAVKYPILLPGKKIIFLFTLLAIVLLVMQHNGIWGRDAGTALFVTALGLKLLEIKKDRDLYLATYLSFFVAATQFLYIQNILMAGYIFVVCSLLLCTLIFINSQNPELKRSLRLSCIIVFQAIPLMIVMFIFFPRLQTPRFAFLYDTQSGLSGLSDTLEPGSITELALSDQLAFRVTFDGKIPPNEQRYWRGPVLSRTDGKKWTHVNYTHPNFKPAQPKFYGKPYKYKILLEPQKHNWVYGLDMPAEFSAPVSQKADYHLVSDGKPTERAEYQLSSYPKYKTGRLLAKEYRINLKLPAKPSPKMIDFVDHLGGLDKTPKVFINNVLRYFKEEQFFYTLKPPLYPDKPIEAFLFEGRKGFCSHYATAFVYLMRVAHIPARVVTGYQGGELNTVGNFLEVRQANAHAWAEVWLPASGWTRYDPTTAVAPERVEQDINLARQIETGEVNFTPVNIGKKIPWLDHAKSIWSNIDYSWHRWIINYNSQVQSNFLNSLGIGNIKNWILYMVGSVATLTVILSLFLLRTKRPSVDEAKKLYMLFCRKLNKIGLSIQTGEGPSDFSKRCAEANPARAEQIWQITHLYTRIRYGRINNAQDLMLLKKLVNAFNI